MTLFIRLISLTLCLIIGSFLLTSCSSQKTIVHSLEEKDANEILVFLKNRGIMAIKIVDTSGGGGGGGQKVVLWDIEVPEDRSDEAMAILNANGLPRRRTQNLLNIFAGQGLVPTEMEQKIRYQTGLAEQIASVIRKIDGVLDADVQISFPEENPLNPTEKIGKVTASVYVKHNGVLDDPNTHLITKIKRLVASSVPALNYDDVTIIPDLVRFAESTSIQGQGSISDAPEEFVSVWSIIIAKDSVSRFRTIFFSFSLIILILLLMMIWIFWKIYPLMKKSGGFKELFSVHPLKEVEKKEEAKAPENGQKPAEIVKEEVEKENIVKGEENNSEDERT